MNSEITSWISRYAVKNNIDCLVIGISGGVDSALTSTLCANTGKKTIVVSLPIHQEKSQLKRAEDHIKWLCSKYDNVSSLKVNLSKVFDCFSDCFKEASSLSLANSRSRLRMTALYQIASSNNGIVVGTGNKVEDFGVGFFTKYGDGGVDISPIADCLKTQVWEMGKELGINPSIINAAPTDGLWSDGRNDEQQLGMSYQELEEAMSNPNSANRSKYLKIREMNLHKMNPIPVCKFDE